MASSGSAAPLCVRKRRVRGSGVGDGKTRFVFIKPLRLLSDTFVALEGDALPDRGSLGRRDGVHSRLVLIGGAQHHARARDAHPGASMQSQLASAPRHLRRIQIGLLPDDIRRGQRSSMSFCHACQTARGCDVNIVKRKCAQFCRLQVCENHHASSAHVVQRHKVPQPAHDLQETVELVVARYWNGDVACDATRITPQMRRHVTTSASSNATLRRWSWKLVAQCQATRIPER